MSPQVWLFSGYISVVSAINMFQMNFLVTKRPFRCSLPAVVEEGLSFHSFSNHSEMVGECEMLEYLSGGECHKLSAEDPAQLNTSGDQFNGNIEKTTEFC